MRIYLDTCCYNRSTDDQTQNRIHAETEAVLYIIKHHEQMDLTLIGSTVINYELEKYSDKDKQLISYSYYNHVNTIYDVDDYPDAESRADSFKEFGVGSFDGLHLTMAEYADVDVLLTTDDGFVKAAKRTNSKVKVKNPLLWLMEVTQSE